MSIIVKDRVKTTSSTSGNSNIVLSATADDGFQSFAVIGDNQTYYCIKDGGNNGWEVGIGTISSSGTALSRDTILSSSNAGAVITLTSNSHSVFTTYPAEKSSFSDLGLNLPYQVLGDTISGGDPVGLNADGTVSKIKETTLYNKTDYQWESGTDKQRGWAFDPDTNTICLMFNDSNNSNYPTVVGGSFDPATAVVTWGTPTTVISESNGIQYDMISFMKGQSFSSNPSFIGVIRPTGNYDYYKCGWWNINGTTVQMGHNGNMSWYNFSNSNPVSSGGMVSVVYDHNTQYMVCAYQYGHYNGNLQLYAGYVRTLSTGFSTVGYGTFGSIGYHTGYNPCFKMVMDENLNKPLVVYSDPLNSNKLTVERMDSNGGYGVYSAQYPVAITSDYQRLVSVSYDPSSSKMLILHAKVDSPYTTSASLVTYSGNTGSYTTTNDWNGADNNYTSENWGAQSQAFYQASTEKTYYGFLDPQNNNTWTVLTIDTASGGASMVFTKYTTASAGSYTLMTGQNVPFYVRPNNTNFDFYTFNTTSNSTSFTGISQTTSNVGDYLGLAITGNTSGNQIAVNLFGSINSEQSGLTSGSNYFVSNTGTVGLTGNTFVGKALSSTQIQITSPPSGERSEIAGETILKGKAVGFGANGKVFNAINTPTGNVTVGEVANYATIGTDLSTGFYGSATNVTWDDDYNVAIVLINNGSTLDYTIATPSGTGWSYSTLVTLISSNKGGVAIAKGLAGDGTPEYYLVMTTTNTGYQDQTMTFDGTTFTVVETIDTMNSGQLKNTSGAGGVVKVEWSTNDAKTSGGTKFYGSYKVLGSYAGQYYESGKVNLANVYCNNPSNNIYAKTVQINQVGSSQSGARLPSINGFDMVQTQGTYADAGNGNQYAYIFVGMRKYGYSDNWGMQKFYNAYNTMQWIASNSFLDASPGNNVACGLSMALNESGANPYLYLFCTRSNKLSVQVYNPQLDQYNSQGTTAGQITDLITDSNFGGNLVVCSHFDIPTSTMIMAYGVVISSTDQRMYYGTATLSQTAPYISMTAFTNYFASCGVDSAGSDCNTYIHDKGNSEYILINNSASSSFGTKKASLINIGVEQNLGFDAYIGIAQSQVALDDVVSIKMAGSVDSNQTGLVVGTPVVVNGTTGAISSTTSVSSTDKQIGVAPTTTTVILQ